MYIQQRTQPGKKNNSKLGKRKKPREKTVKDLTANLWRLSKQVSQYEKIHTIIIHYIWKIPIKTIRVISSNTHQNTLLLRTQVGISTLQNYYQMNIL